ncbi:MAG TPA: putative glycoside hydrolase [Anaerolineales bacterium]|nr:putative glycoside hydrolase [Anaerolineales bacterium]
MENKNTQKLHPILYFVLILLTLLAISLGILYLRWEPRNVQGTAVPSPSATIENIPLLTPTHGTPTDATVRLAWFTSLPKSSDDIFQIAQWFDLYILIQGDEDNRDVVKNLGVEGPILQYVNFDSIQDPGSCVEDPKINQVADLPGDFCQISEQHPDWFLLDMNGEPIVLQDGSSNWYLMDPGNTEWRSFYLDRIKKFQADPNWDGVFLDNVPVTLAFREADGNLPAAYPTDASYQVAIQGFLKFLYEEYFQPNGKLLFANLVSRKDDADWVNQINYLDGAMHEGWAIDWPDGYRSSEAWEKHMQLAEQTQKVGKYIVLVSQGTQEDITLQRFAFASYMLINHGWAAFRYANSDDYNEIWLYENYAASLGKALGERYQVGAAWKRDFMNGSVIVNPETHEAEIIIK